MKKSRSSLRINRGIFFQGDNQSINVIVTGMDDPTPEGVYIKVRGSYNRHRTGLNVPITYYYNHDQYVVSHYRNNSPK